MGDTSGRFLCSVKKDRLEKKIETGYREMREFGQSGTPNTIYPIKDITKKWFSRLSKFIKFSGRCILWSSLF